MRGCDGLRDWRLPNKSGCRQSEFFWSFSAGSFGVVLVFLRYVRHFWLAGGDVAGGLSITWLARNGGRVRSRLSVVRAENGPRAAAMTPK